MRSLLSCCCAIILFFVALPSRAYVPTGELVILVHFESFRLELTSDTGALIATYAVALPKPHEAPPIPAQGVVSGIEEPPWWHPTARTKRFFLEKKGIALPDHIPPGDPRNAMGVAKILVAYSTPGVKPTARIHGTNEPSSIGKRASGGCIRMRNDDILDLVAHIRGYSVRVIFVP